MFYEIVIAPSYTPDGLDVLKGKSKTLRILEAAPRAPSGKQLRQVAGGWLQQGADDLAPEAIEFAVVSEKQPTPQQVLFRCLFLLFLCAKKNLHSTSKHPNTKTKNKTQKNSNKSSRT